MPYKCKTCDNDLTLGDFAYNQNTCWNCFEEQVNYISSKLTNEYDKQIITHLLDSTRILHGIRRKKMIKGFGDKLGNRTEMIFGTGDIGFNSGMYMEKDRHIGIVTFYNQEPRKIGSAGDIKAGTMVNINDFSVAMKFHKVESIDALIKSLNEVKSIMLKNILIEGEDKI